MKIQYRPNSKDWDYLRYTLRSVHVTSFVSTGADIHDKSVIRIRWKSYPSTDFVQGRRAGHKTTQRLPPLLLIYRTEHGDVGEQCQPLQGISSSILFNRQHNTLTQLFGCFNVTQFMLFYSKTHENTFDVR